MGCAVFGQEPEVSGTWELSHMPQFRFTLQEEGGGVEGSGGSFIVRVRIDSDTMMMTDTTMTDTTMIEAMEKVKTEIDGLVETYDTVAMVFDVEGRRVGDGVSLVFDFRDGGRLAFQGSLAENGRLIGTLYVDGGGARQVSFKRR